jgi:HEAT repeat protein
MFKKSPAPTAANVPGSLQSLTGAGSERQDGESLNKQPSSSTLVSQDVSVSSLPDEEIDVLLSDDKRSEVQLIAALREVAKRGNKELYSLSKRWLNHSSYLVRIAAIEALAASGEVYEPEIRNMLSDSDPLVRKTAAESLANMGGKSSIPFMMSRYEQEKNNQTKAAMKIAIEKINGFPLNR